MPEPKRAAEPEQQTSDPQTSGPETAPQLVLVTGPGRSGTSAVTGALSQLGIQVPPPLVDWNRSNKRGFFETRWVVDFQRKVLTKAHTYEFDADPRAIDRIPRAADEQTRAQLTEWLKEAADGHRQVVIKDPRSVWLHDLWVASAEADGLEISYLTMLRHPTEVVGSRSTYYGTATDERHARDYAISKVAGWINVSLLNERQTRSQRRIFLRYTDLLADWRTAMARVRDVLGLEFNASLAPDEPNPVDDFISPELHRIRTGWDELDVPAELRQLAEEVWAACERVADDAGDGDRDGDGDLDATFDALTERYNRLYRDAAAISSDTAASAAARATAEARARTRKQLAEAQDARAKAEQQVTTLTASQKPASAGEARTIKGVAKSGAVRMTRLGRRAIHGLRRRIRP